MKWYHLLGIIVVFIVPWIVVLWGCRLPPKSEADKSNPYSDLGADG